MTRYSLILCSVVFAACNTTGPSSNLSIQPGTYTGTFSITNFVGTDSASTQQSQTAFSFSNSGTYSCGGGLVPTGGGNYSVADDSLYLQDTLGRVAIGDWTLVLNGSFYGTSGGGKLNLSQNDKAFRRYRAIELTRQ